MRSNSHRLIGILLLFLWGMCLTNIAFAQRPLPADTIPSVKVWKKFVMPVSLIGAGLLVNNHNGLFNKYDVRAWRNRHFGSFHTHIDDFTVFLPGAAVYGLDWLGVKAKHDFLNRTVIGAKAVLVTGALTYAGKYLVNATRPDGDRYSFPSGHSAIAFMGASILHEEFGHHSPWISIAGYSVATATASMRILNNRHWLSDVLAGAGVGILGTKLAYLTHKKHWKWPRKQKEVGQASAMLMPTAKGFYIGIRIRH